MVKNLLASAGDTGNTVQVRHLGWGDPLEDDTATHSSAWKIPQT